MTSVTLFGIGSPIVVDVEESCRRAGWTIRAGISNVAVPPFTSPDVPTQQVTQGLTLTGPILIPLFTPANRRLALSEATTLDASEFPYLIDPTAILPTRIDIAEGVYINAGCTLGAASRLGRFSFINRGACLGHHLDLGAFASIGPGAVIAGQVTIGQGAMIGAGAVILPGRKIGANAVIGAGAVIETDIQDGTVHRARRAA